MPIYFVLALSFFTIATTVASRLLLALYALKLGAQPLAVGVLAATFSAFPMALAVTSGKLADRFGSRWPLVFGAAGLTCGMLVPYFHPELPSLYIAAAINGVSFALFSVSLQNLIGIMSKPDDRTRNFSNFSLVVSTANFAAPVFVGFTVDHAGHDSACFYLALLPLVPLITLAIWGGVLPGGGRAAAGPKGSILATLSDPGVWRVLVTSSLLMSGLDLFQFYIPIYGHGIGLSASAIGIVLGMSAVAAFSVRLILPHLIARLHEEKVLAYAFFVGAVSFMLVPFFENVVVLAMIAFMFGLGMGCGQPIVTMLTFSNSAQGRSGEALGIRMTVNHLTRVIGPVAFGALGSAFGLFAVFWGNAVMLGCGGALSRGGKPVGKAAGKEEKPQAGK